MERKAFSERENSSFRKDPIPSDSELAVGAIVSPWSAYLESSSCSSGIREGRILSLGKERPNRSCRQG